MTSERCKEWLNLEAHAESLTKVHLSKLIGESSSRQENLQFRNDDLFVDFSKQRVTEETIELLVSLARERGLSEQIGHLFSGGIVNPFENRPALHTALRLPSSAELMIQGENVVPKVHIQLSKMEILVKRLHSGQWRGISGLPIKNLVHVGVGGSDLGPLMTNHALCDTPCGQHDLDVHFVSSMDGSQIALLLDRLDPLETVFTIASKSFTTIDTLANAETAKNWIMKRGKASEEKILKHHFIGISSAPDKMTEFGISKDHQLEMWDWVGGRYSMWSTIGLPIAVQFGMETFRQFLAGAHSMDTHFANTPFEQNIPVLMALLGVWNINFLDIHAHAVLPYDGRLKYLPAYLEQLEMESNGKRTRLDQTEVDYATCPIIWGEVGPNAQHAFYQLLHQGTERVMCDFIAPARRYDAPEGQENSELQTQHSLALANCFAQSRVLALGDHALSDGEERPIYKRYHGNQPSTTILLDELTPYSLGQLIALYEHKVFVQSVIWQINPFDQWGVELGKVMANETYAVLTGIAESEMDSSTEMLIRETRRIQGESA